MKVDILRFADNGDTTISVMMIDGVSYCFGIEDEERDVKVKGETRIPNGTYKLSLRKEGGFHNRYKQRYGEDFHKGMLCVHNAPNWKVINNGMEFQYILIHAGNTDEHTAGCYLPNYTTSFKSFTGSSSRQAYEEIYPILRDAILEHGEIEICYQDIEKGK